MVLSSISRALKGHGPSEVHFRHPVSPMKPWKITGKMVISGGIKQILKYDHIWKDGEVLAAVPLSPNFKIITKRWDTFQRIIFTEYKQTRRVRAQLLALKVTKEELEKVIGANNRFTERISRNAFRLEIGGPDREI